MNGSEIRNRQFLSDLFAGPFRGHGLIMSPPAVSSDVLGDFIISERPVRDWVPWAIANYQAQVKYVEAIGDDSVPYVRLATNTGVFASAFGCPIHVYDADTNACALPVASSAEEADRLSEASLNAPALMRFFELARLLRAELGPQVPIGVPDIQSPFDIAALVWNKEDLFPAMIENPDAVHRLVAKCHRLLKQFFTAFLHEFPECNLCHCPIAWAPPQLGVWLSEDEVGSFSGAMFDEFCLPALTDLSSSFGGLFIHCCANADHQYAGFKQLPSFRGFNRHLDATDPKLTVDTWAGRNVLMIAWATEEQINEILDLARPDSRFLFDVGGLPLDEAKAVFERLRRRCPKTM